MPEVSVRMFNLGDIVTPNLQKGIEALTKTICNKFSISDSSTIKERVYATLIESNELINEFKLGRKTEKEFDAEFIAKIREKVNFDISVEEFNAAWDEMNPTYAEYGKKLEALANLNKNGELEIPFFSFTNPKDMRYFAIQLILNKKAISVSYKKDADGNHVIQIKDFMGMRFFETYSANKTKDELIKYCVDVYRGTNTNLRLRQDKTYNVKFIYCNEKPDFKIVTGVYWDKKSGVACDKVVVDSIRQEEKVSSNESTNTLQI